MVCMSKKTEESIDLYGHCEVASVFLLEWVMPRRLITLLGSWRGQLGSHNILEVWRMGPLCLMCCIWRERNTRSFEDTRFWG